MGLRFRKSFGILGDVVKLNVNKNSVSITAGVPGFHYTVNSKGNTTTTVGIPGTGISYSTRGSIAPTKIQYNNSRKVSMPVKKNYYCSKCLTDLNGTEKYCSHCGSKLGKKDIIPTVLTITIILSFMLCCTIPRLDIFNRLMLWSYTVPVCGFISLILTPIINLFRPHARRK